MKWISLWLGLALTVPALAAPTPTAPSRAPEERYLFIVDTSSSMRKLARESRQAVFDLVYWGVDGHMQPKDTYGIWTVDDELHAGEFPMQTWRAEQQMDLATKASLFLKDARYRKEPNYGKLSISLLAVVMNVKDVHIFIITDAEAPLVGIPLDGQIREACRMRARERAAANKPFVIYLSARQGEIQSATVAIAGESFKLPPRATPNTAPRQRSASPTVVNTKKPAGRVVALGYVDPEGLDAGDAAKSKTSGAEPARPGTAPAEDLKPTPRPSLTSRSSSETQAVVKAEIAKTTAVPHNEAAAIVKKEIARAAAVLPPAQPKGNVAAAPSTPVPQPAPPPPLVEPAPTLSPSARPPLVADPLPVAARERQPGSLAAAAPAPVEPILSPTELFVVAGVLFLVVVGLVFSFLRRLPRSPSGSYISRSMDEPS